MFYLQCIDLWLFWKYNLPPQPTPWRCGTPFLQNTWHLHLFLAADHLTIEWGGGYGWFQIKILRKLIWREKLLQGNTWEKKIPALKICISNGVLCWKKIITPFLFIPTDLGNFFSTKSPISPSKVKWLAPKGEMTKRQAIFQTI